jgi:hypothetical protein
MDRAVFADESCQGTNGSKALVAGGDTAAPGGLEIREKEPYELSGDIDDRKTVDRFPGLLGHEGNQLAKRITVGSTPSSISSHHRASRQIDCDHDGSLRGEYLSVFLARDSTP